jgi:HTH-type transcriptional regulator/antitoxin HipB
MMTTIAPIPVTYPHELGVAIRAVRIASNLTQAETAALCGVSAPFLNGLERGKPTAQVGLVFAVCRGLGIRIRLEPPVDIGDLSNAPRRKPGSGGRPAGGDA